MAGQSGTTDWLEAFAELLASPDPEDLPRRAHVLRCAGDPDRRATRLPSIQMAYLQRRLLAREVEESREAFRPRGEPAGVLNSTDVVMPLCDDRNRGRTSVRLRQSGDEIP